MVHVFSQNSQNRFGSWAWSIFGRAKRVTPGFSDSPALGRSFIIYISSESPDDADAAGGIALEDHWASKVRCLSCVSTGVSGSSPATGFRQIRVHGAGSVQVTMLNAFPVSGSVLA